MVSQYGVEVSGRWRAYPKIELHRHLEGALSFEGLRAVLANHKIKIPCAPAELKDRACVTAQMNDLREVLARFDVAQSMFVTKASTEDVAYRVTREAAEEGIKILELRFSPGFMAEPAGLDWDHAFEAVLRGATRAADEFKIGVAFIAITTREFGVESCKQTVDFALRWKDSIHAVDLAGNEDLHPPKQFSREFGRAKEAGLKVTIHAGEGGPARNVKESVDLLFADRIGHGIRIIDDREIRDEMKERGIVFEQCPTSNYLTRSTPTLAEHPLKRLFDHGVKVTLNSDDPGIFDMDLTHEYEVASGLLGFKDAEIETMLRTALDASFLPAKEKREMTERHFGFLSGTGSGSGRGNGKGTVNGS